MTLSSISTPEGIQFRLARAEDSRAIVQMVREERINPMGLDWRRFLLAVASDGAPVGCVQIKPHGDGTRELASLVVSPAYRGRGLARQLIERIRVGQAPPLYLMCRSELEPLYTRFGFLPLAKEAMPGYYRRILTVFSVARLFMHKPAGLSVMRWE